MHLVPTVARFDDFFWSIATDKREIDRGFLVGGVFEVTDHDYDVCDYPRCTLYPGWHGWMSSSGILQQIKKKPIVAS